MNTILPIFEALISKRRRQNTACAFLWSESILGKNDFRHSLRSRLAGVIFSGLLAVSVAPAFAETNENALFCAAHFQARADWMGALGMNDESVAMMERYAERLWLSVPKDCGMQTGLSSPSCTYAPDTNAALKVMQNWVEQGYESHDLPTCMEDATCQKCISILQTVSMETERP